MVTEQANNEGGGWLVGRFMPIELDVALSIATGYFVVSGLDTEFGGLVEPLAPDWKEEASEILGRERRIVSLLELASECAGTTFRSEYSEALLAVRSLDPAAACEALAADDSLEGESSRRSVGRTGGQRSREEAVEELVDRLAGRQLRAYEEAGLSIAPDSPQLRGTRSEARRLGRILAGGDLHDRFWHWLDRFYYEWYQPWRRGREELMLEAERKAAMALGRPSSDRGVPRLDWLPPQNTILMHPELQNGVFEREIRLYFWVEPFGLADTSIIRTGAVCVSFGTPGRIYAEFRKHAETVASRAKAIGDPTRLLILRLIRQFPLMNTELAQYLEIARPTASIHAKILREAGLISSRQDGHAVRHEINREAIKKLFDDLNEFLDLRDE